ncbi:MAG: prepilin-type N-terminal cleavage/methylation domain-containing protein [Actinomycetota bacterium]|nr:prepilin-type N-terminal cleavage/methylation domain-containing protein [Actinomycetota bacterium]
MPVTPSHPLAHRVRNRVLDRLDGRPGTDAAFTLIELMVVLLILAILLAIAIPTFLGVTGSANDRAAQSNLNTALTDAKGIYEHNQQSYPVAADLVSSLKSNEPSLASALTTVTNAPLGQGDIGAYVSSDQNGTVLLALAKKTGNCWVIADNTSTIVPAAAPSVDASVYGSPGIPTSAGEYYAVWNTAGGTPCEIDKITSAVTATQTAGFPSQASAAPAAPSSAQCPPVGDPTAGVTWTFYAAGAAIPGGIYYYAAVPDSGPTWNIQGPAASPFTGGPAGGTVSPFCFGT